MGRKPRWLYEVLPLVYVVSGIATVVMLQNAVAVISGTLLLSAGALVLTMRHNFRTSGEAPSPMPVPSRQSDERNTEQGAELLQVMWRPAFEVGHDAIDRQHQRLVTLGNEVMTALMQCKPREDVELMFEVLVAELGKHLGLEEKTAAADGQPMSRTTQEAHRALLARASELSDGLRAGQSPAGDVVGFIAFDLIAMHIVKEDLRLHDASRSAAATGRPLPERRKPAATAASL